MTELEKAAASICGVHPDWSKLECFRIGFKEGAEWQAKQSPWISVEDCLPKESAKGLARVKHVDGHEEEMVMRHICNWVYPYIETGYITHWMPIPE